MCVRVIACACLVCHSHEQSSVSFPTFSTAFNAAFLLRGFPVLLNACAWGRRQQRKCEGTFDVIGSKSARYRKKKKKKKMSCCAIGCKNRHGQSKEIRFYRIPSMSTPFNVERRGLWLKAINRSNWSDASIRNARICSVHFISGKILHTFFPDMSFKTL